MKFLIFSIVVFAAMILYMNEAYERDMARCQAMGHSKDVCALYLR
jgi:hypothetical protein